MNTDTADQAPAQAPSVEERAAAALFGSSPPPKKPVLPPAPEGNEPDVAPDDQSQEQAEATTEETPPAEEFFEFEQDGQSWQVPKALEKALMHNRDYTQKTQALADKERSFEAANAQIRAYNMRQQFDASVAQEMQQLAAYDSVLNQRVDWSQLSNDQALQATLQRNQWKDEREALARTLSAKHQQFMEQFDKAMTEAKAKGQEAVAKRIPNWSENLWKEIRSHAINDGYSDSELSSITDPRHQVTLWKAQQYDLLKSKATKTVADIKSVKTTPSNPMPQSVKDKLAFNRAIKGTALGSPEQKRLVEARAGSIFAKR
jgi:hypothetical protein